MAQALQRLEIEGLLESRPRVGTRVKVPMRKKYEGNSNCGKRWNASQLAFVPSGQPSGND